MAGFYKFKDSEEVKKGKIKVVSEHVRQVQLDDDNTADTSGFSYFYDEECNVLICDCSGFTTVFRELEDAVQYSDDGSVYVEEAEEAESE